MEIVGKVVQHLLDKQAEVEFEKYFQIVGKKYAAQLTLEVMRKGINMGLMQHDKQPERYWYDYEEEIEEPKAIFDRNVRLKYVL